jgi:hypothetical protein
VTETIDRAGSPRARLPGRAAEGGNLLEIQYPLEAIGKAGHIPEHWPVRGSARHFFFAGFDFATLLCAFFAAGFTRALVRGCSLVAGVGDRA